MQLIQCDGCNILKKRYLTKKIPPPPSFLPTLFSSLRIFLRGGFVLRISVGGGHDMTSDGIRCHLKICNVLGLKFSQFVVKTIHWVDIREKRVSISE